MVTRTDRSSQLKRLWKWLRRSSIRRKILGIVLIGGFVPVGIALLLTWYGMNRALDSGVGQFLLDRSTLIANTIGDELEREIAAVEEVAELVADVGTFGLPADCLVISNEAKLLDLSIQEVFTGAGGFEGITIALPLSTENTLVVKRVAAEDLFEEHLPRYSDELAVMIVNENRIPLLQRGVIDLDGHFGELLDREGTMLEGWDRTGGSADKAQVVAFSRVRDLERHVRVDQAEGGWIVLCRYSLHPMIGGLEAQAWTAVIIGLLSMGLFLALSIALAQKIIRSLRMLSHEATEIAAGNFNQRVEVHTNDEVEDLAEHMNTMALRLDSTLNDLEGKIRLLHEKTDQLETLAGITQAISKAFDRPHLLRVFENEVSRGVDFDGLWVAHLIPGQHCIEITHTAWRGMEPPAILQVGARIPLDGSRAGEAIERRRANIAIDLGQSKEIHWEDEHLFGAGCRSVMVLPLASPDMVHGVVGFAARTRGQLGAMQADVLLAACRQLAIGLEHAELHREVQNLAENLEETVRTRTDALRHAQRRLFQQEKFASTGQLAANVAHEINNPLAIIKNHLALLSYDLDESESDNLTVIREEIDRIARIVHNLLSLYRRPSQENEDGEVDINSAIEALTQLAGRGMEKHGIEIKTDLTPDLPKVKGSADLARQVLLNLMRNAEDAMSEGGTLTITSGIREGEVVVEVRDTGCGITPENMEKIFDPFFTTKEESGTGLGLSVSYGIAQSLGGTLEVESEVGQGTVFTLRLPFAESQTSPR